MTAMHEVDYEVVGEDLQYVKIELDPGEAAVAEAGSMMYIEDGIEMETIFGDGSSSRAASWERCWAPVKLSEVGGELLAQKDSFLCAAKGVSLGIAFTKRFGPAGAGAKKARCSGAWAIS